jgi:hypothetical protein
MQNRVALVLAGLSLVISILALSSVGGATNASRDKKPPAAFALVNSDDNCSGACFVTNNGFDDLSYAGDGNYCLTISGKGGSSTGRVAIVAAEDGLSGIDDGVALWQSTNEDCPEDAFQVETHDSTDSSSNQVAFTILVP